MQSIGLVAPLPGIALVASPLLPFESDLICNSALYPCRLCQNRRAIAYVAYDEARMLINSPPTNRTVYSLLLQRGGVFRGRHFQSTDFAAGLPEAYSEPVTRRSPRRPMPYILTHNFVSWDGTSLFYRAWLPEELATHAVLLFHRGA